MAIIQLTWVDASTNENQFNIYRSKDNTEINLADSSTYDQVAELVYDSGANPTSSADWANTKWPNTLSSSAADDTGDFQLTSGNDNLSTSSGSTYVATYTDADEPTVGFKWAVTAKNAIGESTPTPTSNFLDIN